MFGLLGIVLGPIVVVTAISLVSSYVNSSPPSRPARNAPSRSSEPNEVVEV